MACVHVNSSSLFVKGVPMKGGLLDGRMGSIERLQVCETCKQSVHTCPGHTGYTKLALPVYHTGHLEIVMKILRSVCFFCFKVRVSDSDCADLSTESNYFNRKSKNTFLKIYTASKMKRVCTHCKAPCPVSR